MLSDREIKSELGKNIVVHPLIMNNIRASSLNLTASKYAWSLKTKKSIVENEILINIPPRDTALVLTNENLHVSAKISGTYHSKVALVSKGVGHIGTLLNPMWIGQSLIALHNQTDQEVKIGVNEVIVAVCFYRVGKSSTFHDTQNTPGRLSELLKNGIVLDPETERILDSDLNSNIYELTKNMKSSVDFNLIKEQRVNWRGIAFISIFVLSLLLLISFTNYVSITIAHMKVHELIIVVGLSGGLIPLTQYIWNKSK